MLDLIETERLLLRPIHLGDLDAMFEMDSNPEVHLYLGKKPLQTKQEMAKIIAYIEQQYSDFGIGRYAVVSKENNAFMGWCGLKFVDVEICGRKDYYDLGYRFLPEYWGKGIATESAQAWLQHAFNSMNLTEVWGMANIDNRASNHILQKIGLCYVDEQPYDGAKHNCYKITAQNYRSINGK